MLPEYQLKIADSYNISIRNVKTLLPNLVIHYEDLKLYLKLGLKLKKNTSHIRIQSITMFKIIY